VIVENDASIVATDYYTRFSQIWHDCGHGLWKHEVSFIHIFSHIFV